MTSNRMYIYKIISSPDDFPEVHPGTSNSLLHIHSFKGQKRSKRPTSNIQLWRLPIQAIFNSANLFFPTPFGVTIVIQLLMPKPRKHRCCCCFLPSSPTLQHFQPPLTYPIHQEVLFTPRVEPASNHLPCLHQQPATFLTRIKTWNWFLYCFSSSHCSLFM